MDYRQSVTGAEKNVNLNLYWSLVNSVKKIVQYNLVLVERKIVEKLALVDNFWLTIFLLS